jgi:hypothetical protein
MARLIDTTVQTDTANYNFRSREEAEVFFLSLKNKPAALGEGAADQAVAAKQHAKKFPAMQPRRRRA